jgi:hypothetical protein
MLNAPSKAAARRGVVGHHELACPPGKIVSPGADEVC